MTRATNGWPDVLDRFYDRITLTPEYCWNWDKPNSEGYGKITDQGIEFFAHRWAYLRFVGPIPQGLDLDHLCRNRACCNPWHLEPVTRKENVRRGLQGELLNTHCKRGHEWTEENTYRRPDNPTRRQCRACIEIRWRAAEERKRAK